MENNLNNQKPVEFFSAERIKIEIKEQKKREHILK